MLSNLTSKLAVWLLKRIDLTKENRILLTTQLLSNLKALPLTDPLEMASDGSLKINGRSLNMEEARSLRESAKVALTNPAIKLTREHVAYAAITIGVHQAMNNDQTYFAKTALWYHQQLLKQLQVLAGEEIEDLAL